MLPTIEDLIENRTFTNKAKRQLRKFIGMDDDYHVFALSGISRQYCTVNVLPADICEYKHTS